MELIKISTNVDRNGNNFYIDTMGDKLILDINEITRKIGIINGKIRTQKLYEMVLREGDDIIGRIDNLSTNTSCSSLEIIADVELFNGYSLPENKNLCIVFMNPDGNVDSNGVSHYDDYNNDIFFEIYVN